MRKKKKKKKSPIGKNGKLPKVMIVTGDTMLIRDFIMNDLKHQFNLSIQIVSPTVKRTATTFKMQIFDGSQSNAAFKENALIGAFNASKLVKLTPN